MKKDQNTNCETAIGEIRREIDNIDNQIIALLEERMKLVSNVGEIKKNNHEKFFVRCAREADMIKNLIAKSKNKIPAHLIIDIWRKIITAANLTEQPLHIALHNPKNNPDYLHKLQQYYNNEVPVTSFDSVANIVSAMEKGESHIGIFSIPSNEDEGEENWWINLANNKSSIKIFTKIPFLKKEDSQNKTSLVAVAIKEPEKSSSDHSLLCIELDSSVSRSHLYSALKDISENAAIIKSAQIAQFSNITFYLVDIDQFLDEESAAIKSLQSLQIKPYIKILGHYPSCI